jgi:hypothetical protein
MKTRFNILILTALATLTLSALAPTQALARGMHGGGFGSAQITSTQPASSPRPRFSGGTQAYGRNWCYWHPYACYRQ